MRFLLLVIFTLDHLHNTRGNGFSSTLNSNLLSVIHIAVELDLARLSKSLTKVRDGILGELQCFCREFV